MKLPAFKQVTKHKFCECDEGCKTGSQVKLSNFSLTATKPKILEFYFSQHPRSPAKSLVKTF